jgi:hypothetical protein
MRHSRTEENDMQLVDRIEKRRFVGREFLLFLWFESELFDATLSTRKHGSFGLWLERALVLSEGKESTRILAPDPGRGREAKEALLRGQLPESAGIRVAWNDEETSFILKADTLAVASLKLRCVLAKEEPSPLLDELAGKGGGRRKASAPGDDREAFFERMALTQEFEELLETLYRDFLTLRLSARWAELVLPGLRSWARGELVDADLYVAARNAPELPASSPLLLDQPQLAP